MESRTPTTYTEENIRTLRDLEPVRHRPTQFLPDTEAGGLTHQAKEIIDNAIDELAQLLGASLANGLVRITLCQDSVRGTFQLIIHDNGRGIPVGSLVDSLTKLHTSGKFDTIAYATSAGLYGLGAKVAAGTSLYFLGITHRPDGVASLLVQQGEHPVTPAVSPADGTTGVTIVLEPDPAIFSGIGNYAEEGYTQLLDLLKKYVFFRSYPIEFRLSPQGVPATLWHADNATATAIIEQVEQAAAVLWTSSHHDRDEWIRHYWTITRPFAWQYVITKTSPDTDTLHDYILKLYAVKFEAKGDAFGLVNNVPIDRPSSNHISVLHEQLSLALAPRITDTTVRRFFLESYRLPIFVAVDVRFEGAQFAGTTKDAFVSAPFREIYGAELKREFASPSGVVALNTLYDLVREDIEARYLASLSGKKTKNLSRIFLDLNYPKKFKDCRTRNRRIAELFLMEGESAGGGGGHDSETQAKYILGGKPKNNLKNGFDQREVIKQMFDNEIYQDIFRIINYDPLRPNLANLNFGRGFIFADGDAHGRHIAALLIGNFYAAAPELVASGFFGVVAPPYYEVSAGRKKSASVYVRDERDLIQWKALNLYDRELHVDIAYTAYGNTTKSRLTQEQLIPFAISVTEIGQAFENLSNEFALPPLLVEALAHVTYYLTEATMNTEAIRYMLGADRVEYDNANHTLFISVGRDDHVIPLYYLQERIGLRVGRLLQRIEWRNWEIFISGKNRTAIHDLKVSLFQLYEVFKTLDHQVQVDVLKGIGSMKADDAVRACMDPRNRRIFTITHPGDVQVIYDLLGDDSTPRKNLLTVPPLEDPTRAFM